MPACKVCGHWFVKIKPQEELCDKCESALYRLSGYVARVTRCKDCKHCEDCKNCANCNNCSGCTECESCEDCGDRGNNAIEMMKTK